MTRPIRLQQSYSVGARRQPLLNSEFSSSGGVRVAEMAGGTTAECAAVCCCCPCGMLNLAVLAVYKLPAGLCRKALRKQRHRQLLKRGILRSHGYGCDDDDDDEYFLRLHSDNSSVVTTFEAANSQVIELEKQMMDKFYGAGFWRSPSQKSDTSALTTVTI